MQTVIYTYDIALQKNYHYVASVGYGALFARALSLRHTALVQIPSQGLTETTLNKRKKVLLPSSASTTCGWHSWASWWSLSHLRDLVASLTPSLGPNWWFLSQGYLGSTGRWYDRDNKDLAGTFKYVVAARSCPVLKINDIIHVWGIKEIWRNERLFCPIELYLRGPNVLLVLQNLWRVTAFDFKGWEGLSTKFWMVRWEARLICWRGQRLVWWWQTTSPRLTCWECSSYGAGPYLVYATIDK